MGQAKAFSVVKVPTPEQEDELRLYRERQRLNKERTGHRARIKSLAVLHGATISDPARMPIEGLRDWDGKPLPPALQEELRREQQRLQQVQTQLQEIETRQREVLGDPKAPAERILWKLVQLKAVGMQSGWVLAYECFGWRKFRNRKCLGSFVGLTGTPYDSGDSHREQGISKAGNKRVRAAMIELAWGWTRWQPHSALTLWYKERFGNGTKRMRRIGIVALARKLLIALWKYVEHDEIPEGAVFMN
jgi:transposase